ncbi:MAG: YgfZ/GcvT domain-containing protein [Pontibacterium sp.]
MNQWLDLLRENGADISEDNQSLSVPHTIQLGIYPLLHQSLFAISGSDTDKFLQGQLTCDLNLLREQGSLLGAHCNVKGHMSSIMRLVATEDGVLVRTHNDLLSSTKQNLGKYIIFSKAEIQDTEQTMVGLGLAGNQAANLAKEAMGDISPNSQVTQKNGAYLISVPGERYELWLPQEQAIALLPSLLKLAALGDTNAWLSKEIEQAIPDLRTETVEAFIPQMTNLQAFEGVSFRKGCYTGQEIVTRLQHRGQLKRPMYRLTTQTDTLPVAGTAIANSQKDSIGQVVFSAWLDKEAQTATLLAVAVKDSADANDLKLGSKDGAPLTIEALPYTLDQAMFEPKHRL